MNRGLDRLLGAQLLSLRAFAVSSCYSLASIFLTSVVLWLLFPGLYSENFLRPAAFTAGFAVLGAIPVWIRGSRARAAWYLALVVMGLGAFGFLSQMGFFFDSWGPTTAALRIAELTRSAAALLSGLAFDFAFITAIRVVMRWSAELNTAFGILALVSLGVLAGCLLVVGPHFFLGDVIWPATSAEHLGNFVMRADFIDLLASLLFVAVALLALTHRVVRPLLEGPMHALQRAGMIGRRTFLISSGVALLAVAVGINFARLRQIFDNIAG